MFSLFTKHIGVPRTKIMTRGPLWLSTALWYPGGLTMIQGSKLRDGEEGNGELFKRQNSQIYSSSLLTLVTFGFGLYFSTRTC